MTRKLIAIDLAKNVFELATSVTPGKVESSHRLNRQKFTQFMLQQAPAHIVMEACGTAHYWAREFQAQGHRVTLLPGQHTRAYCKGNKTDRNDAAALLEAIRCEKIKPVPIKRIEQQMIQTIHRLREQWKATRVRRINVLKAVCREHGIEYVESSRLFLKQAMSYIESPNLSGIRSLLILTLEEVRELEAKIDQAEQQLREWSKDNPVIQQLQAVPGIGLLTSTATVASVGDPNYFSSGRQLSAWLGITPREHSSGDKRRLGHITRHGDVYLRTLFIHGARSALISAQGVAKRQPEKLTTLQHWAVALAKRIGHNKATVALANKMVRIVWAMWKYERTYQAELAVA